MTTGAQSQQLAAALPAAAYVHVPFCRQRCGYCDFTLIAGRDELVPAYLQGLSRELRFHPFDPATGTTTVSTLFFGGGTPTHPCVADLERLLVLVRERFDVTSDAEVSVEANPLDLTDDKLRLLREQGVNRLSLGVQSFSDAHLKTLERDHTADDLHALIPRVRQCFENLSIDLIFGVPGQTMEEWRDSLEQAIALGASHVSTYGLTFEPGTAFETRRRRGLIRTVPEELEREMYALAMDRLSQAGFVQYEISNFARPGFECRHNLAYWQGDEYFAYGPGAARYLAGRRETNIRSVLGWLARLQRGMSPVADVDELPAEGRARELLFVGLRKTAGIDFAEFQQRTGYDVQQLAGTAIARNLSRGWLEIVDHSVRLTREGRFVADRVVADFL